MNESLSNYVIRSKERANVMTNEEICNSIEAIMRSTTYPFNPAVLQEVRNRLTKLNLLLQINKAHNDDPSLVYWSVEDHLSKCAEAGWHITRDRKTISKRINTGPYQRREDAIEAAIRGSV